MSSALMAIKASGDANTAEQKRLQDRKRNILSLVNHFLIENGYIESAERLQHETGGSVSKFTVADNIDLNLIMGEYEVYYELKFDKKPKFVRKLSGEEEMARNQRVSGGSRKVTSSKLKGTPSLASSSSGMASTASSDSSDTKLPDIPSGIATGIVAGSMSISGTGVSQVDANKYKKQDTLKMEDRMLKPPPQFGGDNELKQLANTISRDIFQDCPNVNFDDIVGLDGAKRLLIEAVQLPLKFPFIFTGILRPWRGILLHGPPGTGKTLLAKAVATECQTTFFNISASTLVSKWRGDSEKLVRVLFEVARYHAPSTIFLDEIDSILTARDGEGGEHEASRRMKTELLIQMDGVKASSSNEQVFVMAASNLPWDLDFAVLRRLEKRVLVTLPEVEARELMLRKHLGGRTATENFNFRVVAERCIGYSGADIELVCREAAMMPVRRLMKKIEGLGAPEPPGTDSVGRPPQKPNSGGPAPPGPSSTRLSKLQGNFQWMKANSFSLHEVEALLKADPVNEEDLVTALSTTKPSSDGKFARYESWQLEHGSS